jgi:hypothetical protein
LALGWQQCRQRRWRGHHSLTDGWEREERGERRGREEKRRERRRGREEQRGWVVVETGIGKSRLLFWLEEVCVRKLEMTK